MQALVIDIAQHVWDESQGFSLTDLPMPKLDEAKYPEDAASVIYIL